MTKGKWKKLIIGQITVDSDLITSFDTTINILSEILEERDNVYKAYKDTGSNPVTEFTTERGQVNLKPNPLLRQWQELNVTALQYLRDLGLSPAGLKKLQGQLPKSTSRQTLDEFRRQFE